MKTSRAAQAPLTLTPYIIVKDAASAIRYYVDVFDAVESYRLTEPKTGKIGHADLRIGDGQLMLADEYPDWGAFGPASVGGTPVSLHLYVADVDATVKRAADAGATVLRQPKDEFFGDRSAMIMDPFGHRWHLATRKEDVAPAEMQKRWSQTLGG
jgi:PhnB protein